jgi:hypothetical protein
MNWSARGNVLNQYLSNTSIGTTVNKCSRTLQTKNYLIFAKTRLSLKKSVNRRRFTIIYYTRSAKYMQLYTINRSRTPQIIRVDIYSPVGNFRLREFLSFSTFYLYILAINYTLLCSLNSSDHFGTNLVNFCPVFAELS